MRYATAGTVPGTRSFHHFTTNGLVCLNSKSICGKHNFLSSRKGLLSASDLPIMSYFCCAYDSQRWIGVIVEIDTHENDLKVNFFILMVHKIISIGP